MEVYSLCGGMQRCTGIADAGGIYLMLRCIPHYSIFDLAHMYVHSVVDKKIILARIPWHMCVVKYLEPSGVSQVNVVNWKYM